MANGRIPTLEELGAKIDGLHELMQAQFKGHIDVHEALQVALETARDSMATRLEAMNQFRSQLEKQAGEFATRDALAANERETQRRLQSLELARANQEGRLWALGAGLSALTIVLGLALRFLGR